MDAHEEARSLIARCLAADAAPSERRRLSEHLASCAECRRAAELSARAVRGIGEYSFAIDPRSRDRVRAALASRARELEAAGAHRRRSRRGFALALAMTAVGSLAAWQAADWFAAYRHLAPRALEAGVMIFWILPSLWAALLLLTPRLAAGPAGERKAEP